MRRMSRLSTLVLLAATIAISPTVPAQTRTPTCTTTAGQTVCGYNCVSASDTSRCAQSPYGACAATDGAIVCADPPDWEFSLACGRPAVVQCITQYDQVACGYYCVANDGHVACARTEWGACIAQYDQVQCWDPAPGLVIASRGRLPHAQCYANYGHLVCGYNCMSAYDNVACAETPAGTCWARAGRLSCSDPVP